MISSPMCLLTSSKKIRSVARMSTIERISRVEITVQVFIHFLPKTGKFIKKRGNPIKVRIIERSNLIPSTKARAIVMFGIDLKKS